MSSLSLASVDRGSAVVLVSDAASDADGVGRRSGAAEVDEASNGGAALSYLPGLGRGGLRAVGVPGTRSLTLPRFAPDVPATFRRESARASLAAIAQALVNVGILTEEDVVGEIRDTVLQGIKRIVSKALPDVEGQTLFEAVSFGIDDDMTNFVSHTQEEYMDEESCIQNPATCQTFFMRTSRTLICSVQRGVMALEAVEDGAGWSAYHILCSALREFDGVDPRWAMEEFENNVDSYAAWDDAGNVVQDRKLYEDRVETLRESFESGFPYEMRKGQPSRSSLESVVARDFTYPVEAAIAKYALLLGDFLSQTYRDSPELLQFALSDLTHIANCPPTALRWCKEDSLERVLDDHQEMLNASGEGTEIFFVAYWQTINPNSEESLPLAARRLATALEILRLAAPIFNYMKFHELGFGDETINEYVAAQAIATLTKGE